MRGSAERLAPVAAVVGGSAVLPGWRLRVLDGNHLPASEKRLAPLRQHRGAALPGRASAWLALVGVALVGTVVAVSAFFAALERLGPSDTAVVSTVEPVVALSAAAVVLGERLGPVQVAGGVLVLLAVLALARLAPDRSGAVVEPV